MESIICAQTDVFDATNSSATTYSLEDDRDNNDYNIRKLTNTNCWMVSSARYYEESNYIFYYEDNNKVYYTYKPTKEIACPDNWSLPSKSQAESVLSDVDAFVPEQGGFTVGSDVANFSGTNNGYWWTSDLREPESPYPYFLSYRNDSNMLIMGNSMGNNAQMFVRYVARD